MPALPLHPALVHLPVGLAIAMPFVAIALAVAVWKGLLPRGVLAVLVGLQLLLAATAFAAMEAGHKDEERAERVAPKSAIHEHEEAGERVVWGSIAVLALASAAAFAPSRRVPLLASLAAAGTLVVAGLALDAGRKGGTLVFQYGAGTQIAPAGPAPASAPHAEHEHEHEAD